MPEIQPTRNANLQICYEFWVNIQKICQSAKLIDRKNTLIIDSVSNI